MPSKESQKGKNSKKPMKKPGRELSEDDLQKVTGGLASNTIARPTVDSCISKL
jgi:bacteriocin-like protein